VLSPTFLIWQVQQRILDEAAIVCTTLAGAGMDVLLGATRAANCNNDANWAGRRDAGAERDRSLDSAFDALIESATFLIWQARSGTGSFTQRSTP
jgi:hypothetical protein